MLPVVVAALFAFGVFLPVHWADESREGTEYFGDAAVRRRRLSAVLVGSERIVSALACAAGLPGAAAILAGQRGA